MAQLISKSDEERIVNAVKGAEKDTSGEIRVHLQTRVKEDIFTVAKKKFADLGMTATELRNGVLIFIALKDRKFAVLGDQGINDRVPDDFWESTVAKMTDFFSKDDLAGGVEAGLREAGRVLKEYFPYQSDDVNELSDEISVADEE